MRLRRSISAASVRLPVAVITIGIHPTGHCRRGRPPCANFSGSSPMRSSKRLRLTPSTDAIPISRNSRSTASCFHSRTRSIPKTCERRPGGTRATTSISPHAITCSSISCAKKARSFSPRRSTRNTTGVPAIRADGTNPPPCCHRCSAISAARGPVIRPTRTTQHARPRSVQVRARACRSAPIW